MPDIPQNTGTMRPANQKAGNKDVVGISFPFRKEDGEFPKRDRNVAAVQNDVLTLFKTPLRSRIHRPRVGHNGYQAVFESQGSLLNARLQRLIRQAIKNNEPRVQVIQITIETDDRTVTPTVDYVVQGVKDSATLDPIQTQ